MATRAERFRAQAELEQSRGKPRRRKVKKTFPGEVEIAGKGPARKRGVGHTATRNVSQHAAKKATHALDDSATTPSRKSTRKSANRSKFESKLHIHAINVRNSSEERAARATTPSEKPKPNRVPRTKRK